jgi:hypothetical protein
MWDGCFVDLYFTDKGGSAISIEQYQLSKQDKTNKALKIIYANNVNTKKFMMIQCGLGHSISLMIFNKVRNIKRNGSTECCENVITYYQYKNGR